MEPRKKILIVDDEAAFTEMVKFNLEATGRYQVFAQNDSAKALDTALEYLPDLILLDIVMPDPEGPDVLFQLRAHPTVRHIPVIFLTATVRKDETNDDDSAPSGYVFLAKPCTLKTLIECIENHL